MRLFSCENDLRLKRELLSSSGLDESDPEKLLDKVKERGQGQRARQELEQWTQLLIEYVDLQETAIERRRKLLSLLDQSCIFYQVWKRVQPHVYLVWPALSLTGAIPRGERCLQGLQGLPRARPVPKETLPANDEIPLSRELSQYLANALPRELACPVSRTRYANVRAREQVNFSSEYSMLSL